ncbi:T9SS type A sorting domain-containing protein [Dyadobacter sp. NIV53]|uniref:T9SS type A sorting domain-containing protein n=1 Tax=Dyadobacter sp. NIV53 TaxID=2861765 RepID=UPI001C879F82|nr:T9SS type A sorting domain-containing protein [Dyadobacter sp. NIV53]
MTRTFKNTVLSLLIFFGTLSNTFAQNDADPAITSFGFGAASVPVGGTTTLSLFFLNNGDFQSLVPGSIAILVSLTNAGEYTAEPESGLAVVSGLPANYFTWTYNPATKALRGVLNTAITPGDGGQIDIVVKGVAVGSNTSTVNIQRLQPANLTGDFVGNNTLPPALLAVTPSLPVTLISFNAQKENSGVNLTWVTTEEVNSDYFEVQHSVNGKSWSVLGKVESHKDSKVTNNYTYSDANPGEGMNYYRLNMVDRDATHAYSRIRSVDLEGKSETNAVFPNPAATFISIDGQEGKEVKIFDVNGVLKTSSKVQDGQISINNLRNGLHLIQMTNSANQVVTKKFVVLK